jgi:hypothetical protein
MWRLEGVDVDGVRQKIRNNKKLHELYVDKLEKLYRRRQYEEAAWLAMFLGHVSWLVHCGQYSSLEVERVLNSIGGTLDALVCHGDLSTDRYGQSKRHVLHVISSCYHLGGHTRAMSRMIVSTSDECVSSVVITTGGQLIPEWLIDSVNASGGMIHRLDHNELLLHRARTLRGIAKKWADLIVLHIDPNDVLANLAFSHDIAAPIVLFNHADHVFWYGATIADTVGEIRPAGRQLSRARRGVLYSKDLPIPLSPLNSAAIPGAKVQLGFSEDDIVMLSVASAYKYKKLGSIGFFEIHERILRNHPKAKLLVVGPEPAGEWQEYYNMSGGRITAVGLQKDLKLFYSGADIYVDSYPFSSLTSMLDFCLYGKPAIGLANSLSPTMSCDEFSLNATGVSQETLQEYETALVKLIEDVELRKISGEKVKQQIIDDHTGVGWRAYWNAATTSEKIVLKQQVVADEITNDDMFVTMMDVATNNWTRLSGVTPWYVRKFGVYLKTDMMIDNMLKRNFSRESRMPLKYFISQSVVDKAKDLIK